MVAQAADNAGFGGVVGDLRNLLARLDQERSLAFEARAEDLQALFGGVEGFDDDVVKLLAEERFGGLFPGRVDVKKVGEDAAGAETAQTAGLQGGEEVLYSISSISAVREDFVERLAAGLQAGVVPAAGVKGVAAGLGLGAGLSQGLFETAAAVGQGFKLELLMLKAGEQVAALGGELALFLQGGGFFGADADPLAVEPGEELFNLGDLVAQSGSFAEEAEDGVAEAFLFGFAFLEAEMKRVQGGGF